jgi:hypothetical protein
VPETPGEWAVLVGLAICCLWVFAEPGDVTAQKVTFWLMGLIGVGLITYGVSTLKA